MRISDWSSDVFSSDLYMAAHLPDIVWQPSERDDASLASIAAWRAGPGLSGPLPNLRPPARIDLDDPEWAATAAAVASYPVVIAAINVLQATWWAETHQDRQSDGSGKSATVRWSTGG